MRRQRPAHRVTEFQDGHVAIGVSPDWIDGSRRRRVTDEYEGF